MQIISLNLKAVFQQNFLLLKQAAPRELSILFLFSILTGFSPAIALFLSKVIIDEISDLITTNTLLNSFYSLWQNPILMACILGWLILNLVSDILSPITTFITASLRDQVQKLAKQMILEKVAYFPDIALFETPDLLNLIQLAEKGIKRLEEFAFMLISSLNGIFTFIPALLISSAIAWWIPCLVFPLMIPSVYIDLKYRQKTWKIEESQASILRYQTLYETMLLREEYAKEIRLFALQTLFLERWQNWFLALFQSLQKVRQQGTILIVFWSIFSGLGIAIPYFYIIIGVLNRNYTLGDIALYSGLILQVRRSLFLLMNSTSNIYEVLLGTRPIFQLIELQPKLPNPLLSFSATNPEIKAPELILNNVSFSYPNSSVKALSQINLKIEPNEMIAVVGENGSGKSTLIKLLCRFYDPEAGQIIWNGQDIREINLHELRSKVNVLIQDYAHFPLSLRENIAMGDLSKIQNNHLILQTLNTVGLKQQTNLEIPLGKQLENGIELSEGQWQQIALARCLIRLPTTELLILDEPTAFLDANHEEEIYQLFQQMTPNKTVIMISHRLFFAKLADRIVVLEQGNIREMGTHDQLMRLKGKYCQMFQRQSRHYYA